MVESVSDDGTSFFGFNFNVSEARTNGIGNALITSLNTTYNDVVKSNLDLIYETVIDEYTTSTVKVKNIFTRIIRFNLWVERIYLAGAHLYFTICDKNKFYNLLF